MVNVSLSFQSVAEMLAFFGNRDVEQDSGPIEHFSPKVLEAVKDGTISSKLNEVMGSVTKTIAETVNRECAEPHTSAKAETPAAKAEPILASDPDMAADYQEKPVVYRDVAEAINALVVKNRAKAVEVLASFGVKKGTELEPKGVSLAKALEALTAALDED